MTRYFRGLWQILTARLTAGELRRLDRELRREDTE